MCQMEIKKEEIKMKKKKKKEKKKRKGRDGQRGAVSEGEER